MSPHDKLTLLTLITTVAIVGGTVWGAYKFIGLFL